jgi:hypothetical protein
MRARRFGMLLLKWVPIAPMLVLIWYSDQTVEKYPARIGVTHRSCSDPANTDRLEFRQQTYCVKPDERQTWDEMWRNVYALIAVFIFAAIISSIVARRERKLK